MTEQFLTVKVMTPTQVLYQGPAIAVSSKSPQGPFDLLAQHANFITLIENEAITILTPDKKKQEFHFKQAIIYLTKNIATILAEPKSLVYSEA